MSKTIVSVGLYIADNRVLNIDFDCHGTLTDGDIIIYQPNLSNPQDRSGNRYIINHWQNELLEAYNEGKTIIVYMPYPQQQYFPKAFSNETKSLFYHLPTSFAFSYTPKDVKKIEIEDNVEFLQEYWKLMKGISSGTLTCGNLVDGAKRVLKTYTGNKAVGVLVQDDNKKRGEHFIAPTI